MAVRELAVPGTTQVDMLHAALATWESAGVRFCVLHGYQNIIDSVPSDVDCMVDPEPAVQDLIRCAESDDIRLVQHLQHESTCHYLVFHSSQMGHFLTLDVSSDYRHHGRIFYSGQEILERRQRRGHYWIPSPEHEFGYYLIKKIAKGRLDARHAHRLSALYRAAPDACRQQIGRFWPDREAAMLQHAASSGDWSAVVDQLSHFRRLLLRPGRASMHSAATYWAREARRRAARWLRPTGLHVVFLGPDGSGKSTVVDGVEQAMSAAFRATSKHHLRPAVVRRGTQDGTVTSPHASPPRGMVLSLAKLGMWFTDYFAGYHLRIRPRLVRSTLVLFDRYYLDLLVDPARYRYGGPRWLAAALWRLLPKPDVIVALDAPAEVLHSRKREVPLAETERQRRAYRVLVASMPNGHIVDASQPPEAVIQNICDVLIDRLAARTAQRLGLEATR